MLFTARNSICRIRKLPEKIHDYSAERITSYLNLVDKIVKEKPKNFKTELSESKSALENYIAMLPNTPEHYWLEPKKMICI
jgi:hypothetical protein